MYFNVKR